MLLGYLYNGDTGLLRTMYYNPISNSLLQLNSLNNFDVKLEGPMKFKNPQLRPRLQRPSLCLGHHFLRALRFLNS